MKGQQYADVIRRLARKVRVEAPPSLPSDKRRLVSAVEQALRARARRRLVIRRGASVAVALVAVFALVVGAGRLWRGAGGPRVVESTGAARATRALMVLGTGGQALGAVIEGAKPPVALRRGMAVGAGLTLRAPASGDVRVGTADGTSLALEGGGELAITESAATQRFALRTGAVSARVSRLFAGERFIIDTEDAEIEVHGTAFRVAIVRAVPTCGDGSTTRVSVREGVVRVRAGGREVSVPAGGAWPEGCDLPAAPIMPSAHVRARVASAREARSEHEAPAAREPHPEEPATVAVVERPPVAAPLVPVSSLEAENDLFATAVRAKKQGRLDEAARLFGDLVASHPGSPLVESAMVQQMNVLAVVDRATAARVAADYLRRYPDGFARPEARELARRSSP